MKKSAVLFALAFCTIAGAADIAFYVGPPNTDGWYTPEAMNEDVATIIDRTGHLFDEVEQFDDTQFDAFGAWVDENTDDGEMDILWLNGTMPSVLYPFPNLEPDGSRIEEWLDGGNMIINVGDWFGYVSYEGGSRQTENGPAGAANILDLAEGIIAGSAQGAMEVTPTGAEYLPSLNAVAAERPVTIGAVVEPWEVAAMFGQNAAGTHADPIVIHNTETDAYVAFINQASTWIDERGLVVAEFITNWVATVVGLGDPSLASDAQPEDQASDVPPDVVLSWTEGDTAATHDVYFGTDFNDVNEASRTDPREVLVSQDQTDTTFDPNGTLDFGTTYYWRVDEVNAPPDSTIFKGPVWSFTVEPVGYSIPDVNVTSNGISEPGAGPENTINGSGLNADDQHSTDSADMWLAMAPEGESLYIEYEFDRIYQLYQMLVWNYNSEFEPVLGFGLREVAVEYSEDGTNWTTLDEVEFAQAPGDPTYEADTVVDFGGVAARFVRLVVNSAYGATGQYGLSEVRFLYIPVQPREPEPADGAAEVDPETTLSWRPGRGAVLHEVYLGTDPNALPLVDEVEQASYTPEDLLFAETYYWQVVEVNEANAIMAWAGDIWSFTTRAFEPIEGFETYDNDIEAGTTIFDTWIDGYVNETGSTVGYLEAPFAEQTVVRSGSQSMPLQYENSIEPFYSETARTFETPQDWTGNGADTLVLYVQGNAPDFVETADGEIVMSAIGTDIWGTSDQFRYAYKNLSGDGSITVRVDSLIRSNEWAKAGVMIRETLEPGSQHAFAATTPEPAHGISFQRRPVAGQDSANTDVADVNLPHWVRLTREGNTFTAEQSEDGVNWTEITPAEPVEIQMDDSVYIGLAVTSHEAAITTAAEFSNVETTGNVTGDWQTADIGVAQPEGNAAQPMYVTIEDASGSMATVTSPTEAITVRPTWQQWAIPYSDLVGVDLSQVQTMYIGVGSATNPTADGTGIVFIDDIGYGRLVE